VRRSLLGDPEEEEPNRIIEQTRHTTDSSGKFSFTIPPDQAAKRYLYIELDVEAANYAPSKNFGYALSMIRKNEKLGGRPFLEKVELWPAKQITGILQLPDGTPAPRVRVLSYSNTDKRTDAFEYGSFANARSDETGRFHLWVITPGPTYLWLLPEQYVPETHVIKDNQRGDLGTFTLHEGIRLRGRVVDTQGKPLAGIIVNAESRDRNQEITLPVADQINRSATTNEQGEFAMNPLPAGHYELKPDKYARDASRDKPPLSMWCRLDGVFVANKITLKSGERPEPIEIRACPSVLIEAQACDSKGKPTRCHEFDISGWIDGTFWFGQAKGDANGHLVARVPHGMEVKLNFCTNEHEALRWRRGPAGELHDERELNLGTVNDDVRDIQIIRYVAPILFVSLKGRDDAQLQHTGVTAEYATRKNPHDGKFILAQGRRSDVAFEHQEDGRFRSEQLFPDAEVRIVGHADGYQSKPVPIKLPEGATKEIEVTLEKKRQTPPQARRLPGSLPLDLEKPVSQ
jgi:hypothetical protein